MTVTTDPIMHAVRRLPAAIGLLFAGTMVSLAVAAATVDSAKEINRGHWSFRPLTNPAPPPTSGKAWARGGIDHFILAGLEERGLRPSPDTDRLSWLRRVYFSLAGLPPSPERVSAFLKDQRADAYERVVDELLNSPRYGEKWAQHWLDVVRFADTDGFEVNTERKNAWPYRDYVIRAFNEDTPYDRFILEQLAGDFTGIDAATGFLVTAAALLPGQIGADEESKRLARQDSLSEIVGSTGQTFLGLSIGCARCHNHKFDPVSQRDYYSLQAFFAGVQYGERPVRSPEVEARRREAETMKPRVAEIEQALGQFEPLAQVTPIIRRQTDARLNEETFVQPLRPAVNPRQTTDRFAPVVARRVRFSVFACSSLAPCFDELEVFTTGPEPRNVALASAGTKATASGTLPDSPIHKLEHIHDGRYGNSHSWISNEEGRGWVELEFAQPQNIDRVVWGRDREEKFTDRLALDYRIETADASGVWHTVAGSQDRRQYAPGDKTSTPFSTAGLNPNEAKTAARLLGEKKALETRIASLTAGQMVFAGSFSKPDVTHLLHRGDPEQPREIVPPAVLSALGSLKLPEEAAEQARRVALASWIASPDNPLTARVMVNRLWQGHFGLGLVETASDFGNNGSLPSHPALLDWLATEFIRSGWSIKHLHRVILMSATFRQSSRIDRQAMALDADNRLLWRFPARRLEAETIRDSMLAVNGRLNLKMGGPGFNVFTARGGLTGFPPIESFSGDGLRRMIYAHKVRMERESVFGAFDCPDAGQSTPRRRQSTTPIQALNLFNSRFTIEQSEAFAARVGAETGASAEVARRIRRVYQLGLGRDPELGEIHEAADVVSEHGLPALCRALFNSNEFLFLP